MSEQEKVLFPRGGRDGPRADEGGGSTTSEPFPSTPSPISVNDCVRVVVTALRERETADRCFCSLPQAVDRHQIAG